MQIPGTRKTVASVMATFTKTISDLDSVAEVNEAVVVDLKAQKATIDTKIATANSEAAKASKISAALSAIIDA